MKSENEATRNTIAASTAARSIRPSATSSHSSTGMSAMRSRVMRVESVSVPIDPPQQRSGVRSSPAILRALTPSSQVRTRSSAVEKCVQAGPLGGVETARPSVQREPQVSGQSAQLPVAEGRDQGPAQGQPRMTEAGLDERREPPAARHRDQRRFPAPGGPPRRPPPPPPPGAG